MQVINKKIIVIFICLSIFIFGLFKLFSKEKVVLDEVKLDIRDTNNTFAIYLENEYNSNNYKESDNNEFPKIGYQFNKEKSQCVSIDGDIIDNILSYDNESNKLIVDTTDSINCYLYFDRLTLGDAIKVLKPNGLNLETTSSSEDWTGMYRFQGQQSDNIENYICFGTSAQDECLKNQNKYMYRIIGIEESGRIKVIKKEALEETDSWWTDNDTSIHWNESLIFQHINNETFLNNKELVPSGWEDKIDNHNWLFGSMNNGNANGSNKKGTDVYKLEIGEVEAAWNEKAENEDEEYKGVKAKSFTVNNGENKGKLFYYITHKEKWSEIKLPHEVNAKIGLMNISDYYLSISNEVNCHVSNNNYAICLTGWIHLSQNDNKNLEQREWTMTRGEFNTNWGNFVAHNILSTGSCNTWGQNGKSAIRPAFFLKNNLKLIDGKGTIDEPFIIN